MAKKKSKKTGDGEENGGPTTVVLMVEMDCEGCSNKVKGSLKGFDGVEEVKGGIGGNKLTVMGKVDPEKIRDRVESKTKKKVVLVSPLPQKAKENRGEPKNKEEKKPADKEEKSNEAAATTVAFKVRLHCEGCIQKIRRIISKTKGVELVALDVQKDLVTVKGTIDFKAFLTSLAEKLKRDVEIVHPKKEEEGKNGKQGKKKADETKDKRGGEKEDLENRVESNRMEYYSWGYGYGYGYYPIDTVHAPQLFSDENPNACSVM